MTDAAKQTPTEPLNLPSINDLNWDTITNYDYSGITELIVAHSTKILIAILIFFIGKWIVKRLVNIAKRGLVRARIDDTLVGFLGNILTGVGVAFVVIAALAQMGIETTSLAAVIGAAGLAIGLALQGSLANFAAGVLIILFKPFKAGDYVEIAGIGGTVQGISIFTTELASPDNKHIVIPNGNITTDTIVNYSAKDTRRIDLLIGVSYDADLKKARKVFEKVLAADDRILPDPAPKIAVMELGASSVDFVVRPWVKSSEYWDVRFDLTEQIKIELDKAGVGIPFPQRDVHLFIEEGDLSKVKGKKKAS